MSAGSDETFRDWWRAHSDAITPDNMYDYFERCWETASRATLIGLEDAPAACIANAIERAKLDRATLAGNVKHIRSRRRTLQFEQECLDRATDRMKQAGHGEFLS